MPFRDKAASNSLRLLNPDYEYLFFDDAQVEEFIDAEFPQYRSVFDSFPARIQRYDFFRYLAVYRLGGFYFDTDMLLAEGLDSLLGFSCVFPFEQLSVHSFFAKKYGMDWEVGNYAFGATANHPFLQAIIKNCVRAHKHPEWAEEMIRPIPRMFRKEWLVLATTGPGVVSRTLAEYPDIEQVTVLFPDDVCDPRNWYQFGQYGVHLCASSWRKPKSLVGRVMHRLWESHTRSTLFKDSLKRGKTRSLEQLCQMRGSNLCFQQKPWSPKYLLDALRGFPPDRAYRLVDGPVRPFNKFNLVRKNPGPNCAADRPSAQQKRP